MRWLRMRRRSGGTRCGVRCQDLSKCITPTKVVNRCAIFRTLLRDPRVHIGVGHLSQLGSTPVTCTALSRCAIRRSMRLSAKGVLLLLLLYVTAAGVALAQEKRTHSNGEYRVTRETPALQQQKPMQSRPLTMGESLAILGVALDSRHHVGFASDCSHFVHELYERAGFPYEYASSSDLYAGIDEFRRVANPQPGDLAVWRGHAGIVVNPAQHSFFSVLRSGPGVDSYDSPYWKQRGRPRFFRYVKPAPGSVVSTSMQTASLKPTGLGNTHLHETPAESPMSDISEESSNDIGSAASLQKTSPCTLRCLMCGRELCSAQTPSVEHSLPASMQRPGGEPARARPLQVRTVLDCV